MRKILLAQKVPERVETGRCHLVEVHGHESFRKSHRCPRAAKEQNVVQKETPSLAVVCAVGAMLGCLLHGCYLYCWDEPKQPRRSTDERGDDVRLKKGAHV